jgi:predicted DNA-binding transcriptional regulator YafY
MPPKRRDQFAPTRRLLELTARLSSSHTGVSLAELSAEFRVTERTIERYLQTLEANNEPLIETYEGARKRWRIDPKARKLVVSLKDTQIVALLFSRRVVGFLQGTGIDDDLAELFATLVAALGRYGIDPAQLDRRFLDVNEAPHIYEGRIEHVDQIVSALLHNQTLGMKRARDPDNRGEFKFDPYTLFIYKKGLYLTGKSHETGELRTYALDSLADVNRLRDETFDYPADYDPTKLHEGQFGIHRGTVRHVRLRFEHDERIENLVQRRRWHPTQRFERSGLNLDLVMDVGGKELASWILSWGDRIEVIDPVDLRGEIAQEHYLAAVKNGWTPGGEIILPPAAPAQAPSVAKAKPPSAPAAAPAERRKRS